MYRDTQICPNCYREFYGSVKGQYCPECCRAWEDDPTEETFKARYRLYINALDIQ